MKKKLFWFLLLLGILFSAPAAVTVWRSFCADGRLRIFAYRELFFNCMPFYRMFWNSVLYAFAITVGALLVGIPAAFGLKFAHFPGKRVLYVLYIVLMMMPVQVMIMPNYIGLRGMGLLDTPYAVILPLFFSPLCVVILYQYMREYDAETVDAARLETSSCVRVIVHCILPQIRICIYAAALLIFAESWNLVEQPLLYLDGDKWKNLSLLFSEPQRYRIEVREAAGVIFMMPVFLWYLLFHRELKEGVRL